jgi:hypothetical protein
MNTIDGSSQGMDGGIQKSYDRLTDKELRSLAAMDPYISAIISSRVAQVSTVMRASESRFDKGIKIRDINPPSRSDFDSQEAFNKEISNRRKEMKFILDWVLRCGTDNVDTLDAAFKHSDRDFKYCTLPMWAEAQCRNLLTFGRMSTHYGRSKEDGKLLYVRPLPTEAIEPVRPGARVFVSKRQSAERVINNESSVRESETYNEMTPEERPQSHVMRVDGNIVQIFHEDEISVRAYQSQALLNLNGYPLSPIENAMFMVYIHQNTLNYLKNQFTRGLLAKSMILIKPDDPTDPAISPEQLEVLKKQFTNLAMRTDNNASVPVLSGAFTVQNIPLTASTRDMEWLQLEQSIIRAICSAFQIDPGELGLGMLGDTSTLGSGGKDTDIISSQERGLRVLVDLLLEEVNEWVADRFGHASGQYRIEATGIASETFDGFLQRAQLEMSLYSTMNLIRSESDKNLEPVPLGGDVPLSGAFNQYVISRMTYGQFLEHFMGVQDASYEGTGQGNSKAESVHSTSRRRSSTENFGRKTCRGTANARG